MRSEVRRVSIGTYGEAEVSNLDDLGKPIPDLLHGKRLQEVKVQERVHGRMIGSQTVLQLAVVEADLDGDGGIDQANERGGHTNEVAGAPV